MAAGMALLGAAVTYSGSGSAGLPAPVTLPFSPVRFCVLLLWGYACLYFVQQVEFSGLVPKRWKTAAKLGTFVVGPLLLLGVLLFHRLNQPRQSQPSLWQTAKAGIAAALSGLRQRVRPSGAQAPPLQLMDSAGRPMDQFYGHGDANHPEDRILSLTEQIIANALQSRASDILIDPKDSATYTLRLRIDGVLKPIQDLNATTCKAVINSIKAVSNMDISERRRPQDGAFIAKKGEMASSFRVASAGVVNGEKLAIRVLSQRTGTYKIEDTGLTPKQLAVLREAMDKPSGMLLVCGPTGSGKTTTLYAMLNEIDRLTRNVISVEDPIEAVLPHTSQIEINPKADITFAKALRSILRQDPDVICVGEIRDEETAEIALRASQTGHLVLATIHCDSNAAAVVRLLDLGVSPLLVSSGLSLLLSQRLLRCLCDDCKGPAHFSPSQSKELVKSGIDPRSVFEPVGCERCDRTGYYGRTAIGDLIPVDEHFKAGITQNTSTLAEELRASGNQKGRSNLQKQGLRKVVEGVTSLHELKRVVG